ncbi:hypothetical protein OCI51_27600 (plasmid) [Lysinibacillus capsici]|uniref:hypothetical protein n=1 Tax=Lysinibacillus capsici TaxID=2115968 RepID=UPI0021D817FC|nr:hypothetical protein [Lysinibacillus capsici]UYB50404.1 hypothetical protein OCI51_27600 [Lysinibacillus capsici]
MTYAEQNHYDKLSKFQSLKEFNNHFEQAMLHLKDHFTKSEYIALNKLRKFAADISGVAWCKLQRAVAGTHQDETFGVSRATFDRMLRKAKKLNLITVINQVRKNNWQKHNVYVFNRLDEINMPEEEIVSKFHTIDVPDSEKIDAPLTNNLSELPKEKQVKDNNKSVSIADEKMDIEEQRKYIEKYATNEYQLATFKLIESMPMSDEIKAQAHVISLRVGSSATITDFVCAKNVLLNMSVSSVDGLSFDNVVAAFTKAYEQAKNRTGNIQKPVREFEYQKPRVPLYNWLKERSHSSGRAIYNWITGN